MSDSEQFDPVAGQSDFIDRLSFQRSVDTAIRGRRTRKVLAGDALPAHGLPVPLDAAPSEPEVSFRTQVRSCIALAGFAPFHYARDEETPEPWRFRVLYRAALDELPGRAGDLLIGKLPTIVAAAGCMIQVTWRREGNERKDWEHAAASAAAVQNLLLAAEARGLGSYWCSAGPLDAPEFRALLGVEEVEIYLGTLFLGLPLPPELEATQGWSGKLRDRRSSPDRWCSEIDLKDQ